MFRGDECVSLGWCFWHRGCYGCLMCGSRRVVEGVKVEELFGSDEAQDGSGEAEYGSLGRMKGREVDNIPLCAKCVEEISKEKLDEEHLIPMALGRVDRFDGGLSRRRWEARREAEPPATAVPSHPLEETPEDARRPPSPIYVCVHDPIGAPAFKASPTKPIPKWMQYLPNQRRPPQEQPARRPRSILDPHFSPDSSASAGSDEDAEGASTRPPPVPPHNVPVLPRSTVPTYMPVQMSRPFTLITEEPVQRPSSAKATGGRSTPGKQVRFTNIPSAHGPLPSPTAGERAKLPSESAEYLERYHVRSPLDVRSATVHVPSSLDGRAAGVASPFHRRGGAAAPHYSPTSGSTSAASGAREESGSSARTVDHQYHAQRGGYEGYLQSPGSSVQGGDWYADGRRRPFTFQDQLKRVFGFN